jgi:hypothetical protein
MHRSPPGLHPRQGPLGSNKSAIKDVNTRSDIGYIAELRRAIAFTREIGLTTRSDFHPTGKFLSEEFCSILREWTRLNVCPRPDDQIAGRCLRVSHELAEFLAGAAIPVIYTLGWMSYLGDPLFKFSEADVQKWLSDGLPNRDRLDMHAWVTLSSGEVIDASWLSTVGIVRGQRDLIGAVIVVDPEHEGAHRYHPVVVDAPIVERLKLVGLTQDATQWLQAIA